MIIIPSLVENTADDLFNRITYLSPHYHQFQVDIEDGIFIQNKTLDIEEFASYIKSHTSTLPPSLIYDFHFMVQNFERSIDIINQIKSLIQIDVVFVHTALHPNYVLLQKTYPDFRMGLVINPEENMEELDTRYSLKTIPLIQLMTINPGKQGQPFIPNVLIKIEQLRNYGFHGKIYLDGAINKTTLPLILSLPHKPDVLCPGSYLAKAPENELEERVHFLQS